MIEYFEIMIIRNAENPPGKYFMRYWRQYKLFVERAVMGGSGDKKKDITYWREQLFTNFITFLFPICLIALLPGVVISIRQGYIFIAAVDLFVPSAIAVIAFNQKIGLVYRKVLVFLMLYFLAIVLLINLGLFGPGMIYLLALTVIITFIFPRHLAYWSVALNVLICIACSFIIYYKPFNSPLIEEYNLGTWIAISSNLVFLSGVILVLISNTVNRLEDTIIKELQLKNQLHQENLEKALINQKLKQSEAHFEGQNSKLQEIAYIQSHYVRAPLARIIGLVDLIKSNGDEIYDAQLLDYLDLSAIELDDIIKKITKNAELTNRNLAGTQVVPDISNS